MTWPPKRKSGGNVKQILKHINGSRLELKRVSAANRLPKPTITFQRAESVRITAMLCRHVLMTDCDLPYAIRQKHYYLY